jgi:hypothetical protein
VEIDDVNDATKSLNELIDAEVAKVTPDAIGKLAQRCSKEALKLAVQNRANLFFASPERNAEIDALLTEAWKKVITTDREKMLQRLTEDITDALTSRY